MDSERLTQLYGPPTELTNGIILPIFQDSGKSPSVSAQLVLEWTARFGMCHERLTAKVYRVAQKASKLRGPKLEAYKRETFIFPQEQNVILIEPNIDQAPEPTRPNNNSTTPASTIQDIVIHLHRLRGVKSAHHRKRQTKRSMTLQRRRGICLF